MVKAHLEARRIQVKETLEASIGREEMSSLVFGRAEYMHHRRAYQAHYDSQFLHHAPASSSVFCNLLKVAEHVSRATVDPSLTNVIQEATALIESLALQHPALGPEENGISIMAQTRAFYHGRR